MSLTKLTGLSLVLAVSILPTAMPARAQDRTADPVTVTNADGSTEKLTCRRLTPVGSRVRGPKVCRTPEQWQQEEREARDKTRELQRTRNATNGN
ncbi:hypothetical protein KK137_02320 [Croceibacterium sp. LX-88]|uniref:Secreted protein n=1 Tax=Croceibacterium selenioxidans TaxID=2838833 RepID=A0ABS5W054_9SPHN|nr:hypothetical protein [Croceibacterium selenioxidans]MBT2133157.1 hypothetical protein [Croceibacterium selenioxidans]